MVLCNIDPLLQHLTYKLFSSHSHNVPLIMCTCENCLYYFYQISILIIFLLSCAKMAPSIAQHQYISNGMSWHAILLFSSQLSCLKDFFLFLLFFFSSLFSLNHYHHQYTVFYCIKLWFLLTCYYCIWRWIMFQTSINKLKIFSYLLDRWYIGKTDLKCDGIFHLFFGLSVDWKWHFIGIPH